MFHRSDVPPPPPPASTRSDITATRSRMTVAMSRADRVIRKAMAETDRQMFGPPPVYTGPERRRHPRGQ